MLPHYQNKGEKSQNTSVGARISEIQSSCIIKILNNKWKRRKHP